jgi:hypothetical protein
MRYRRNTEVVGISFRLALTGSDRPHTVASVQTPDYSVIEVVKGIDLQYFSG